LKRQVSTLQKQLQGRQHDLFKVGSVCSAIHNSNDDDDVDN